MVRPYPYKWRFEEFCHGDIVDVQYNKGQWKGRIATKSRNNYIVDIENPCKNGQYHFSFTKRQIQIHQQWDPTKEACWKHIMHVM